MSRSDLRDIEVVFQHQTRLAVCVRADEDGPDIWIPKTLCEIDPADPARGVAITLTASEQVLAEKGLDAQPEAGDRGADLFSGPVTPPAPAERTRQQLADQALAIWNLLRADHDRMQAVARQVAEATTWSETVALRRELEQAARAAADHGAALDEVLREAAGRPAETDGRAA